MADRSRFAALKLMQRVKQHELETHGAQLSALRAEQDQLKQQMSDLTDQAVKEASQSTTETRVYLPRYLQSVDTQRDGLNQQHDALEEQAKVVEEQLFDAFREIKTSDAGIAQVAREIARDQERAQTAQMDDATRALSRMRFTS